MKTIANFLMFEGRAEEAMNFYVSLFPNSEIININRYQPGGPGAEGTVMHAAFSLNKQAFMCIDSAVKHQFTFTPAISFYIDCDTEAEIASLFNNLSANGQVMMPLGAYPFSKKYAWVSDRFGVSWQLNCNQ
ncbi:MAG TPA: VOC family protein [Mucilaginibacter sp.]|jgi:predicted 3-demethylubiquinone-9 3-methyltransferase (glyoxalase superfamily)